MRPELPEPSGKAWSGHADSALMTDITTRTAVPADCEAIVAGNCRLAAETESKRLDVATVRSGVRALLADPGKGRYFVACCGDEVVGQVMYTREWSDWRNGEIWWLQSVYVAPAYRRQGVFRRLFRHVYEQAQADPSVVGLRLYVERENRPAQDVYRRLGLQEPGYFVMERLFDLDRS